MNGMEQQDTVALQVEIALLRRQLEDSVKNEREMANALAAKAELPEDEEALQRLGEAFATIEEFRDYLPTDFYNDIGEAINNHLINGVQWTEKPYLVRQIAPLLIEAAERAESAKA